MIGYQRKIYTSDDMTCLCFLHAYLEFFHKRGHMIHCLLQLAIFNQECVIPRLPGQYSGKESTCQFRRRGFDPWVGKVPWRREWIPTPVFLPGKSHGQRSLAGYSPWCHKEQDMTQRLCLPGCDIWSYLFHMGGTYLYRRAPGAQKRAFPALRNHGIFPGRDP